MSLQDVLNHISFSDEATQAERDTILAVLANVYNGSPTGAALLEDSLQLFPENGVGISFSPGDDNHAVPKSHSVYYSFDEMSKLRFINKYGVVYVPTPTDLLMHEIIHAVIGIIDTGADETYPPILVNYVTPGADYSGPTVKLNNIIMGELGLDQRLSYEGTLVDTSLDQLGIQTGESLTHGHQISDAVVHVRNWGPMNLSDRPDNVLLVGLEAGDDITAGSGDDFLYGGDGADILIGGAGRDRLIGGIGNDTLLFGGTRSFPDGGSLSYVDDHQGDLLEGGEGHDKYKIVGSYADYSTSSRSEYYGVAASSRSDAWYILGLNYIDTIRDSDGDGEISVQFDMGGGEVYNQNLALDVFSTFVNIPSDPRANARYNAYEALGAGTGTWQINTGPDTGVIEITARNADGVEATYEIIQAGYGSLNPMYHNPLMAIEIDSSTNHRGSLTSSKMFFDGTSTDDIVTGGIGSDEFYGEGGNDDISGGAGSDYIEGDDGDDNLDGGADNDVLLGGAGNDTLSGGDGDDILVGGAGADVIHGNDGDDFIVVDSFDTSYSGGDGYDTLVFNGSEDFVFSLATSDFEVLLSGSGNDTLTGSDFDDTISAGEGDDQVYGGSGSDYLDGEGGVDTAVYDGLLTDYTFERIDDQTVLVTNASGEEDYLLNFEKVLFLSTGLTLTIPQVLGEAPTASAPITGTSGDDGITGTSGDDTIDGGLGNDLMWGGAGSDTYMYRRGDGSDEIAEDTVASSDIDVLKLVDLNLSDLSFSRSAGDLMISINGTSDTISIYWQFQDPTQYSGLEKILFANGMTADLYHGDTAWKLNGTDGNDVISSPLWGQSEIFEGGKGNDYLYGSAGSDTYVYSSGDGSDEINDDVGFTDAGNVDVLKLKDLNQSDISLEQSGDNLLVHILGTGDVITVDNQFISTTQNFGIERIDFTDGTSLDRANFIASPPASPTTGTAGDDELTGTSGNDVMDGGLGDDLMWGQGGSDTYVYRLGDGSDQIAEDNTSPNDVDVLDLVDLNLSDLSFSRSAGDLMISVNGNSNTISIYWQFQDPTQYSGLEKILFANGMSADLYHGDIAWKLNGTAGDDQISSPLWGQSEIFNGGAGNDYLYGSAGSDTYLYASGDGSDEINDDVGFTDAGNVDVLKFTDLNASDISLQRDGNNLLVNVASTGDVITIDNQFISTTQNFGIESILFADGTSMDRAGIETNATSTSSNSLRMAMATTSAGSVGDDHVDQRPIELGPTTFTLDTDDHGDTSTYVDTSESSEPGIELSYWSTSSDSYEDSQTMASLRQFDSNDDNVLDINDTRWSEFQVWRDSNANGTVDSGEMQSMTEAGIRLVNLLPSQGPDAFADTSSSTTTAANDSPKYLLGDATFVSTRLDRAANAA